MLSVQSPDPGHTLGCKPFWSVMIPTYNPNGYLAQTIESVLAQSPGSEEMQIEVIDDCSTQVDVEGFVKRIAGDRVSVYRQPYRTGLSGNWNTCIDRARGEWVHILHQDDLILPGFYNHLRHGIRREPSVGAAFCRHIFMDADGHWQFLADLESRTSGVLLHWQKRIFVAQLIQTPAIVVKRSVYGELGGFNPELIYALDWDMWKRIVARYAIWYEPRPLACYRLHPLSETSRLTKSGEDIADLRKSIELSRSYLPEIVTEEILDSAKEYYAMYAVRTAKQMIMARDASAALAQLREAFKCSYSIRVISSAAHLILWAGCLILSWLIRKLSFSSRRRPAGRHDVARG